MSAHTYIAEQLREMAVPVGSLVPDPQNARKHGRKNMDTVMASLDRFGQRMPIVVQKSNMVVRVGNARLEAAKRLGWTHIAAVIVDEGDVEATAFALVDNRSSELGEWDIENLTTQLQHLDGLSSELIDGLGWDTNDLEVLLEADWTPPALDTDIQPPGVGSEDGDGQGHGRAGGSLVLTDNQKELLLTAAESIQMRPGCEGYTLGQCVGLLASSWLERNR